MVIVDNFPDTILLSGEKIDIKDDEIVSLYIFDSILVSNLHPTLTHSFRAYNLNTYEKMGDFIIRGRGPGEFVQPSFVFQFPVIRQKEIKIWLKDFPTKIRLLNLSQTLKKGNPVIEQTFDFVRPGKNNLLYESNSVYILNDSIFLMKKALDRSFTAEKKYTEPFYVVYDFKNDVCLDTIKFKYDLTDRLWMDEGKIVTSSYFTDGIDILDVATKKEVILFHEPKQPEELYTFFSTHNKIPDFVYRNCFIKKNLVFGLYVKYKRTNKDPINNVVQIHVFTPQGDPLYNFIINEPLITFNLDERTMQLYGFDEGGQFYKYALQNILKINP